MVNWPLAGDSFCFFGWVAENSFTWCGIQQAVT